jgi:exosome complex RNA-binding protein Rrp4
MKMDETITALNGTYCRNGYIYASIAGTVKLTQSDNNNVCILLLLLTITINYYYYYYCF